MGQTVNIWWGFTEQQYKDWQEENDYKNILNAVYKYLKENKQHLIDQGLSVVHSPYSIKDKTTPKYENVDSLKNLNVVLTKSNGEWCIVVHEDSTANDEYITSITI
jgi:hypothetical protein